MTKKLKRKRSTLDLHKKTQTSSKRRKVSNGKAQSKKKKIVCSNDAFYTNLSLFAPQKYTNTNGSSTPFCDLYSPISFNYVSPARNCYTFRSFEDKDMSALQKLDVQMHHGLSDELNPIGPYGDFLNWIADSKRTRWHHYRTISCATSLIDKAIGFIIYRYVKQSKHVELFWISIDTKHRRNGIAKTLIKLMINQSMKEWTAKHFKLNVLATNDSAIQLYEKMGFVTEQSKINYPKNGYASFRYSLNIKPWLLKK